MCQGLLHTDDDDVYLARRHITLPAAGSSKEVKPMSEEIEVLDDELDQICLEVEGHLGYAYCD